MWPLVSRSTTRIRGVAGGVPRSTSRTAWVGEQSSTRMSSQSSKFWSRTDSMVVLEDVERGVVDRGDDREERRGHGRGHRRRARGSSRRPRPRGAALASERRRARAAAGRPAGAAAPGARGGPRAAPSARSGGPEPVDDLLQGGRPRPRGRSRGRGGSAGRAGPAGPARAIGVDRQRRPGRRVRLPSSCAHRPSFLSARRSTHGHVVPRRAQHATSWRGRRGRRQGDGDQVVADLVGGDGADGGDAGGGLLHQDADPGELERAEPAGE